MSILTKQDVDRFFALLGDDITNETKSKLMDVLLENKSSYEQFLKSKEIHVPDCGITVDPAQLNPMLFDWQRAIVKWSLAKGRCAIFADCGLGKTPMQLEWAKQVYLHENKPVLILAPLAVASQTQQEGVKFGVDVNICETQADLINGINITNYEKLHHFSPEGLAGIVLDESSILKAVDGKYRKLLNEFARDIPYRLCASATPSPNDLVEIVNHSEFLGIMSEKEAKALFFTTYGNQASKWRLKNHAHSDFWRWLASWAVAVRKPSDLGYQDGNFTLPPLTINEITVDSKPMEGMLIPVVAKGLKEQRSAKKASLDDRVNRSAELANSNDGQWLIWCELNSESSALTKSIPDAVEVKGSDSNQHKENAMLGFSNGDIRVLVTKPSIAGFGMNWQNCNQMIFTGLSNSHERYYQAMRRCWRFGQNKEVNVFIVSSKSEGGITENIKRKEAQSLVLFEEIIKNMDIYTEVKKGGTTRLEHVIQEKVERGKKWEVFLGDSIQTMRHIKDDSVGFSIFSPPFPGMYVYNNSIQDVGNSTDIPDLIDHLSFVVDKNHLMRVMMPGRVVAIHITQAVAFKSIDGFVGVKDFRGPLIAMMVNHGWIYQGEVTIDKNPQVKAFRTHDRSLLFKSLATDSSVMSPCLSDMLLIFRKPGENPEPIRAGRSEKYNNPNGWITADEWIEWAHPVWPSSRLIKDAHGNEAYEADLFPSVWYRETTKQGGAFGENGIRNPYGIRETDVINNWKEGRAEKDERHICPLQLGVISRAIKLWSAPDDLIYSPFTGVGSEGYQALKLGRRFVGGELKESYWKQAIRNLKSVNDNGGQLSLF